MYILWISCFFHDSSAALIKNWKIVSAISEERLSRKKHDGDFPKQSVNFCLKNEWISISDIDYIVFYEKPLLKFERLIFMFFKAWPFWFKTFYNMLNTWLSLKLKIEKKIIKELWYNWEILYVKHHESHASSSFFTSNFNDSALLILDWVWEYSTTSMWYWKDNNINLIKEMQFPNSIWLLYSAFTYYLWFKVNDWEYKVMWLAPYWNSKFVDLIKNNLIIKNKDWSFILNKKYFDFHSSKSIINSNFEKLFWQDTRKEWEEITNFHKNIAYSIQLVIEDLIIDLANQVYCEYNSYNLCLWWWVALNCVANSKILKNTKFKNIHIFPASWDDWWAIWAALSVYYNFLWKKRIKSFDSIYLWWSFDEKYIESYLNRINIKFQKLNDKDLYSHIAKKIKEQKVIWWFQWRSEFWPRALWNRSILWDPTKKENWNKINLKIKFRESFRPFAPSILEEDFEKYFISDINVLEYMTYIVNTKNNDLLAVTHVDWTSRVQTVNSVKNNRYYNLLLSIKKEIWVWCLINTSFNIAWDPIVETPQDAMRTFLKTWIDILVLWNYIINKEDIEWKK